MITRNDYELNCLIEGKENILTFFIPCNAEIKELEQVIYDEGGLDDGFQDLALWKVCQEFYMTENAVHPPSH